MKTVQSITTILALVSSAIAQHNREGRIHSGQASASLAPQSAAPAASAPAGASTAVALNAAATTTAAAVANSGNTDAAGSASSAAAPASTGGASSGGSGGNCITFTSDNPSWAYSNSAPWSGSGTFGDLPGGKLCLPSNAAGGAMYIGSSANPGPGNTKLECYFPTDATQQSNCDMSLVDGYSLSVTCTMAGASQPQIGGSVDLWTSGTCPGGNQGGTCKNADGYSAAQSDVNAFFQPAVKSPNNYCIWVNCNQDSFFNTGTEIKCHVSAGTPAARKREIGEAKLHGRSHPRSLGHLVGA